MKAFASGSVLFALLASGLPGAGESYQRFEILTASSPSNSRDKDWKPGDKQALEVSGVAWVEGRLAVASRKGEVWWVDNPLAHRREDIRFRLFASGLHEPLGLLRDGNDLLVTQRAEVTRLQDRDGDGVADAYLTECDGWNVSGNYHAYAYGPERDRQGNLWVTLNLGIGTLANNKTGWRGWGGVIGPDGKFAPKSFGMRSPCGLGANRAGDLFFTDQQGTWIPATPIYHLQPGVFYGNQESLASTQHPDAPFRLTKVPRGNQPYGAALSECPEFVSPAVWLPYNKMGRSATDIELIDHGGKFGPFDGQLLVGEFTNASVNRVFLEKVNGQYQGACFPFLSGFPSAVMRLSLSPEGSLFVGMTNRGWSSLGNRSYGLERVRFTGKVPFAIRSIQVRPEGFRLQFTQPVDRDRFSISVKSFTYQYSSRYGGSEQDARNHKCSHAVSEDGLAATLTIEDLRRHHVFEFATDRIRSRTGKPLGHNGAWYTLNEMPKVQ